MIMGNRKREQYFLEEDVKDINIREFFAVIKKRFWIVLLLTLAATAVGYLYSNLNTSPIYQTSTRIIIEADNNYMSTLMVMIKDPIIMEKVKKELNLSRSPESIANQIEVTRIDESQVIKIDVTDGDAKKAMDIANVTAKSFKSEVGNILNFKDVQLLSEAKQNNVPINEKNSKRIILIAFILGLIASIGFVFLLDSLDETMDKQSQVEDVLGVPVIGVISNMKNKRLSAKKSSQMQMELRGERVGSNK